MSFLACARVRGNRPTRHSPRSPKVADLGQRSVGQDRACLIAKRRRFNRGWILPSGMHPGGCSADITDSSPAAISAMDQVSPKRVRLRWT